MPTGKVKWFDADKGFGFIAERRRRRGVPARLGAARGRPAPAPGTRVEYSVADGRRGPSAMTVTILERPPPSPQAQRKPTDDMTVIIEDLIKMLDGVSNGLRKGTLPRASQGQARSPQCCAPSPISWITSGARPPDQGRRPRARGRGRGRRGRRARRRPPRRRGGRRPPGDAPVRAPDPGLSRLGVGGDGLSRPARQGGGDRARRT